VSTIVKTWYTVPKRTYLCQEFRSRIRQRAAARRRRTKSDSTASNNGDENGKNKLAWYHSGVLGLCALVEAYPYEVPSFVPSILVELEAHLHAPQPVPKTVKTTLQEFKRTHTDNWEEHKKKFTEDQLLVMTELLVSPNYYA